jgi:hypothetical protein
MGGSLSAEDKVLFSSLLQIQGRLAAFTTVVDSSEGDHEMATDSDAGAKSTRADGDSEASAQSKRQKTIADGTQPPQENEPGTGSANGVGSGAAGAQQSGS